MSLTNDAFLKSKIANFCDFLALCLSKRLNNARYSEANQKLNELRVCDTAHFVLYVTSEICPYKSNIKKYIEKLLLENNVDIKDIAADELNKLERYCQCFIDTVEQ